MKEIHEYPAFKRAIQTDELVYLFGTGISSALTGQKYSWWKWITDGIQSLQDRTLAWTLDRKLKTNPSTQKMIAVVGDVIQAAKAEGVYDDWMRKSFETHPINHGTLPATLKKLLLVQDVFVTTNYDLLLEQATGLGTLSYEQPDLVFPMLEEKRSTHVLHIHGIYDSAHNVDNIVASREQYDRVLNDKGAQFIQNILGTRTLILIGCGKTTEDANIAQFLRFTKDWLKLDRPCYFLCSSTQDFGAMPDNIILVPYGDTFDDLPQFLEQMAQTRLQFKIQSNPIISRTAYFGPKTDAYGLSVYHFANEALKFCGRERELAQLHLFAEIDSQISWWAITGQAGAGKSRLAYEFLQRGKHGYFAFFLNSTAPGEAVDQFTPFNHTFVIVDYVKGNELRIAALTIRLMDRFRGTGYKLRLLFLERDNQLLTGSWYQALEMSIDSNQRANFRDCEYNVAIASRSHRFLYLDDLEEPAVVELIGEVFRKKGLPVDNHRCTLLKEAYREKYEQLRFRPLFLQIYVEAYIDNGCMQVDYRDYKELLYAILRREQERILNSVGNNTDVSTALIRLLVRASISDRLEVTDLPEQYQKDWEIVKKYNDLYSLPGVQRKEQLQSLIGDAGHALDPETAVIAPLYPDVIKEAMFLYYIDESEMPDVWSELWLNCSVQFAAFLSRVLMDFPDHHVLHTMIWQASEDYSNPYAMEARLALLQNEVVRTIEEGPIQLRLAEDEFSYWDHAPFDLGDEKKLIVLKGLDYSAKQLIGWSSGTAYEALNKIAALPYSEVTISYQLDCLLEYAHYFVEKATEATKASQYTIGLISPLISAMPAGKKKTLFWLRLQREIAVSLVQQRKFKKAWDVYLKVCNAITKTDEQIMELYAYICFSCAQESFWVLDYSHVLDYSYELQDMAVAYASRAERVAFNDKIHYYYLHAKLLQCESVSLGAAVAGRTDIGLHYLDGLISEIESNEMISDFSGLLVGAWALKIGSDESVTDEQCRIYLDRADGFLLKYPDNQVLAEKLLDLWKTTYTCQFRQKVPAKCVEQAYTLLLRFPNNTAVLDKFHDLLEESVEAYNRDKYYRRREILASIIEHHRTDYLYVSKPDMAPYIRSHPKVGANDPCPCGSKKKFKKCCRGKGIYD